MSDKNEMTPGAALAELEGHCWAIRPEVLGSLVELAQRGRLIEAVRSESADAEDVTVYSADALTTLAARRGRPKTIRGTIMRIPLKGVLMPSGGILAMLFDLPDPVALFRQRLQAAMDDEEVGAILMDVDSPGGVIDNIPELAADIAAARERKPITAVANTQMASAAYFLGAQASELVVTPSGTAGSIGVYATHQDMSAAAEQAGVKVTLIKAGKFKAETAPYFPLSEEAASHIQEDVDTFYDMFAQAVASGRSAPLGQKLKKQDVADGFGEGRSLTAKAAVSAGLADRVESLPDSVARLATRTRGDSLQAEAAEARAELAAQAEADAGAVQEQAARDLEHAKQSALLGLV